MDRCSPRSITRRLPDLGIALKSILGFWLLYMALITLRAIVAAISRFLGDARAARRSPRWSASALTFLVYLALRPLAQASLASEGDRRRRCSACPPRSASRRSTISSSTSTRRSTPRKMDEIDEGHERRWRWRCASIVESVAQLVFPVRRLGRLLRRDELRHAAARRRPARRARSRARRRRRSCARCATRSTRTSCSTR